MMYSFESDSNSDDDKSDDFDFHNYNDGNHQEHYNNSSSSINQKPAGKKDDDDGDENNDNNSSKSLDMDAEIEKALLETDSDSDDDDTSHSSSNGNAATNTSKGHSDHVASSSDEDLVTSRKTTTSITTTTTTHNRTESRTISIRQGVDLERKKRSIEQPPPPKTNDVDLKGYGQRARERFDREKRNRREIKVLDHIPESSLHPNNVPTSKLKKSPPPPPTTGLPSGSTAAAAATSTTTGINNRQISHSKRTTSTNDHPSSVPSLQKRRRRRSSSKNTTHVTSTRKSLWIPDVSCILQPIKTKKKQLTNQDIHSNTYDNDHQQPYQQPPPSTWVVLHGLPKHCTAFDIRRFFVGLDVQTVAVLLPNNVKMFQLFDASNIIDGDDDDIDRTSTTEQAAARKKKEHLMPPTCTARVMVKFESSNIAILATERSGEVLQMFQANEDLSSAEAANGNNVEATAWDDQPDRISTESSSTSRNFVICVTLLDKATSKVLIQHIAVDVKQLVAATLSLSSPQQRKSGMIDNSTATTTTKVTKSSHLTLEDCVSIVERDLPPLVREILWTNVAKRINKYHQRMILVGDQQRRRRNQLLVRLDNAIQQAQIHMDFDKNVVDVSIDNSTLAVQDEDDDITTLSGYQRLANQHNRLATILDDLIQWISKSQDNNTSQEEEQQQEIVRTTLDVSVNLTDQACAVLEEELCRLDNLAQQARFVRRKIAVAAADRPQTYQG